MRVGQVARICDPASPCYNRIALIERRFRSALPSNLPINLPITLNRPLRTIRHHSCEVLIPGDSSPNDGSLITFSELYLAAFAEIIIRAQYKHGQQQYVLTSLKRSECNSECRLWIPVPRITASRQPIRRLALWHFFHPDRGSISTTLMDELRGNAIATATATAAARTSSPDVSISK